MSYRVVAWIPKFTTLSKEAQNRINKDRSRDASCYQTGWFVFLINRLFRLTLPFECVTVSLGKIVLQ